MINPNLIRSDFPILSRTVNGVPLVYFDNAATTQKPISVIDALSNYYLTINSNVHRGVHRLSMEATEEFEKARISVAKFINANSSRSIVWTRNTTESINLVAHSWAKKNISKGDKIVVSQLEHHSNLVPWQQIAMEREAQLVIIPISDDGMLDLSNIDVLLDSSTKLLAITHISNALGTINPVKDLISLARKHDAFVLVDGAQSAPHLPIDVQDLDCDFFVFSGHKMLGPTGIGVLYAKEEILLEMDPFLTGGEMVTQVWEQKASWNDLPMKFEAGTPNIADVIAFASAISYLENLGMDNVRQHEIDLTKYAIEALSKIDGLNLLGPCDTNNQAGVISFDISSIHPHDIGTFLDQRGIAIRTGHHCSMPLMHRLNLPATARASFYIYNTFEEVDKLVDAIIGALEFFGK